MDRSDRQIGGLRRETGDRGLGWVPWSARAAALVVVAALGLLGDGGRASPSVPTLTLSGSMPIARSGPTVAEAALRHGHPRLAADGFAAQLVSDPSDIAAVAGLVEAGERSGALNRVYQFFSAMRRRTPTLAVRLGQAETLFALGRLDASESVTAALLETFPESSHAVVLGALIQVARGRPTSIWSAFGSLAAYGEWGAGRLPTALDRLRASRTARLVSALSPRTGAQLSWRGWRAAKRQGHAGAMQDFLQLDAAAALALGDGKSAGHRAAVLTERLPASGSGADAYLALAVGFEARGNWSTTLAPRVCRVLPLAAGASRQECALTLMEAAWRRGEIGDAVALHRWLDERLGDSASPFLRTRFAMVATPFLKLLGRWQEALLVGEAGLVAARELGRNDLVVELAALLAGVLRSTGRPEAAADLLSEVAPSPGASGGQSVRWLVEWARMQSADGDDLAARASLERARDLASLRGGAAADVPLLVAIELGVEGVSLPGPIEQGIAQPALWARGVPGGIVTAALEARVLEARGQWAGAIKRYSQAGEAVKEWLSGQHDPGAEHAALRAWADLGARRARLALQMGDPAQALEAVESLSTVGTRPGEWAHVLGHLDDATAVLVFAPLGDEMWLWCVDKSGVRATRLALSPQHLSELSRLWVTSVTENVGGGRWRSLGVRLADATIEVARRDGWVVDKRTLIVVPGGGLDAVPFDALVDLDGPSHGWADVAFVRTPSLSVLDAAWHQRIRQPWAVALVPRASMAGADEAREVLAVMPGRMFLGLRATERVLVREASRSSLIHFGGHAVPPSGVPGSGGLDLRPAGDHDGFLSYAEISRLPLEGAVVVLLGCDTSRRSTWQLGQLSGNPRSLSEAFLAAGSRSVVGNLWSLSEAAAGELAAEFYAIGGPVAGAAGLAAAKRALRRRHPHDPARWAGAVWEGVPSAPFVR